MKLLGYGATVAILSSFRCNARCDHCCFGSSPDDRACLSDRVVGEILRKMAETFGSSVAVFSGGEPALRWRNLLNHITTARSHGLSARVVSNGFWASTLVRARTLAGELKNAGLGEINLSTGTNHAKFVTTTRVRNAIAACLEAGISTIVVVEDDENADAVVKDISKGVDLASFSITKGVRVDDVKTPIRSDRQSGAHRCGCDSILTSIAFSADGWSYVCCGLPIRYSPAFRIAPIDQFLSMDRRELYERLMALPYLRLMFDGPEAALRELEDSRTGWEHPCAACATLARTAFFTDKSDTSAYHRAACVRATLRGFVSSVYC